MKIALCLHGLSGGRNSKGRIIRAEDGYKGIQKWFLSKYDIDVFMHSWTTSAEERMTQLYQPKKAVFESQRKFPGPDRWGFTFNQRYYQNMHSLYYSYQQANHLKCQWEQEHGFKYDWVIHARFDLNVLRVTFELEKLDPTKIYFLGYVNRKLLDHFWLSGSETMDKFINIYDLIPSYHHDLKASHSNNQYLNHDLIALHAKKCGLFGQLVDLGARFKGGTFPQRKQNKIARKK